MRPSELVAEYINENFENIECRTVNLDYLQRAGTPHLLIGILHLSLDLVQ